MFVLSTNVIALLKNVMLPFKTPVTNSFTEFCLALLFLIFSADALLVVSGLETPSFSCNAEDLSFIRKELCKFKDN